MRVCYWCEEEITAANQSKEHVIPDFLGGTLVSSEILCRKCNNELGHEIDSELSRQLKPLADLLVSKYKEKKKIEVLLKDKEGKEFKVGADLAPYSKFYIKTGEDTKTVFTPDDSSLEKLMVKKKSQLKPGQVLMFNRNSKSTGITGSRRK